MMMDCEEYVTAICPSLNPHLGGWGVNYFISKHLTPPVAGYYWYRGLLLAPRVIADIMVR